MKQRGFTLLELVITITIMAILLTLAVANINSNLRSQRDSERVSDIATIANNLETYYKTGINGGGTLIVGRYPSTGLLVGGETVLRKNLPRMDIESAIAPGAANVVVSFILATNAVETATGVLPQPTKSEYIYQPIYLNGTLCTTGAQECRRFNLFYRTESDNTVKKMTSRHQ